MVRHIGPRGEAGGALLVLVMKLICMPMSDTQGAKSSSVYQWVRNFSFRLENSGSLTLELLQSILLISVYEVGHGVLPTAYMTMSRAARLCALMGINDRSRKSQLFEPAETWTRREAERRTWWGVFIMDR